MKNINKHGTFIKTEDRIISSVVKMAHYRVALQCLSDPNLSVEYRITGLEMALQELAEENHRLLRIPNPSTEEFLNVGWNHFFIQRYHVEYRRLIREVRTAEGVPITQAIPCRCPLCSPMARWYSPMELGALQAFRGRLDAVFAVTPFTLSPPAVPPTAPSPPRTPAHHQPPLVSPPHAAQSPVPGPSNQDFPVPGPSRQASPLAGPLPTNRRTTNYRVERVPGHPLNLRVILDQEEVEE